MVLAVFLGGGPADLKLQNVQRCPNIELGCGDLVNGRDVWSAGAGGWLEGFPVCGSPPGFGRHVIPVADDFVRREPDRRGGLASGSFPPGKIQPSEI